MRQNGGLRIGGPFLPIYSKSPPPRSDDRVGGSGAEVLPAGSGYKGKGVGAMCVNENTVSTASYKFSVIKDPSPSLPSLVPPSLLEPGRALNSLGGLK